MQKFYFLSVIALFVFAPLTAQDFTAVDQTISTYPHNFSNPDMLATQIAKDFSSPTDKARAAFSWIAKNVRYDLEIQAANQSGVAFKYSSEQERLTKEKKFKNDIATIAVQKGNAVCHGYAALYELVCNKMGLEAVTVTGTLKLSPDQIGTLPGTANHAWNLVKVDGEWRFVDTTLAAGEITNGAFRSNYIDGFFFTSPELFFLNHYPSEEKWLLLKKSKLEFANLPLYHRSYFAKKQDMLFPITGILPVLGGNFSLRLKNSNDDYYLSYFLQSTYKGSLMDFDEGSSEYIIDVNVLGNDYLTIMGNSEPLITYQLKARP